MTRPDHLDPRAPRVVEVRDDRSDRTSRRTGNTHGPHLRWQVFDEIDRDAIVRPPRVDQRLPLFSFAICHNAPAGTLSDLRHLISRGTKNHFTLFA